MALTIKYKRMAEMMHITLAHAFILVKFVCTENRKRKKKQIAIIKCYCLLNGAARRT